MDRQHTIVLCTVAFVLCLVAAAPSPGDQPEVVTGILEELDLSKAKGKLRTDLGKPIFFEVAKPELFEGLTVGERITIRVDNQGRAVKVTDVPAPELKQPLP